MVLAASVDGKAVLLPLRRRRRRRARRSSSAPPARRAGALAVLRRRPGLAPAARGRRASVVYDLAGALPVAERWSSREVAALRHARPPSRTRPRASTARRRRRSGDRFLWSQGEAEVSLTFPRVAPRAAVVDLAPYERRAGPAARGPAERPPRRRASRSTTPATATRVALPAEAQRAGENRLRFVFAATASPVRRAGQRRTGGSWRPRSTRLVVGAGRRRRPRGPARAATRRAPFARRPRRTACPRSSQVGPERGALRAPPARAARAALHARAASGGRARRRRPRSFRVTLETTAGRGARSCGPRVLGAADAGAERGRGARCPARAGDIVRLGLHVARRDARFAWGVWTAPRVLGRGASTARGRAARRRGRARAGDRLRAGRARAERGASSSSTPARAEHFGAYGYARADHAGDRPHRRARAWSSSARTRPPSTRWARCRRCGRRSTPTATTARSRSRRRLPKDRLTLAELLGARRASTPPASWPTPWPAASTASTAASPSSTRCGATLGSRGDVFRQVAAALAGRERRTGASSPTSTSASRTSPTTPSRPSTRASAPTAPIPKAAAAATGDLDHRRQPGPRAR